MKTLFKHPGLGGLLIAQSQVAFNDNATKLALIGLVQILLPEDEASRVVSGIALLLVTPFVIFAPLSGWLADRFAKYQVLWASLWLQFAVMLFLCVAVAMHSIPMAVGGFFLLGLQSALMSPARRGMVKELAGDSVGEAVGWMEMLCIVAILAGSLVGGQLIDGLTGVAGGVWAAAGLSFLILAGTCLFSLWVFRKVPSRPPSSHVPFSWKTVLGHAHQLKTLHSRLGIWRAALGDAAFYFAGGLLMLTLAETGRQMFPDGHGAARITGIMMATMGAGIAVGSLTAARLCRHHILMGLVPLAALAMGGLALILASAPTGSVLFFALLFLLGLSGGLYLVPLGAYLVDRAPEAERGTILAASSMLSSIAGVLAVAAYSLCKSVFSLEPTGQLVFLGVFFVLTAGFATRMVPAELLRVVALLAAQLRYGTKTLGADNLPSQGGVLLVCNHVSYVDTILLSLGSNRPIRFLSYAGFFKTPILGDLLRIFGAIPVSSTKVREAVLKASEAIQRGEVVCIFPEGQLTRTGCLMEIKSGFELIARRANCPVVVAHLDGLWGSIHSFEDGRYFTKWPKGLRRQVTVSFAPPLAPESATAARVREELSLLGEAAFRSRPFPRSLAMTLLQTLRSRPGRLAIVDPAGEVPQLSNAELLVASIALALRWKHLPGRRIGVILPPGLGGTFANLGLLFCGKIPVNMNPTLSREAFAACLEKSEVQCLITGKSLRAKFPDLQLPERVVDMEREVHALSPLDKMRAILLGFCVPEVGVQMRLGLKNESPDAEAMLLFTSGTSGIPKAVALTNRNTLSNIHQFLETGFLKSEDRLLSALPLFHSFGLTVGLLTPLLSGRTLVTAPSPLDADGIADAARVGLPTLLLSTPTFLRNYARRIPRDAFGTLRMAVTGAERLTESTATLFRERFGCEVYQGYGLTEASPVVSLNQPDPVLGPGADSHQKGSEPGSAGRLIPGLAARLLDPESRLPIPGATRGILALRGPNIITNYLNENCPEKFSDGWLVTGDMARISLEGFVFLEGRLSRFSKIGGEMVSHAAVEDAISQAFPDPEGKSRHCVLGRPHPEKGEELVLLTTGSLTRQDLLARLTVPNLWIPKKVIVLDQLPTLATGKLDVNACQRLLESETSPA